MADTTPSITAANRGAPSTGAPPQSVRPAIVLSVACLCVAALVSPTLVEHVVSLNWQAGDIRPLLHWLQACLAGFAVLCWALRRPLTRLYRRAFPFPKYLLFAGIGMAVSVALGLVAVEIVMRLFDLPFHAAWTPPEYARAQFDPEIGWVYIPNWSGDQRLKIGGEARSVPMNFDDIGARVRLPGTHHDASAPTVLFVGCSFTAGYGVPFEDTFAGQLESQPDFPLQVVDLGVEGYGTDQALLLLKRYFDRFNTKVVVYTFIADHVPRNQNYDRRTLFRGARFVGTKPLFGLDGGGNLFLRRPPLRYEDLSSTRLGSTIDFAWTHWGPKPTLDLTRALVQEMKRYVESRGATFIVVAWDWDWIYLAPRDQWPPFRDLGVHLVDAAANAPADWQRWRIAGDSHPNPRAHARIAQLVKDELQADGLLSSRAAPAAQP